MLGYPIHPEVQKTLNERRKVLKRTKNPYASTGGKNPSKEIQKNIIKTPYISMFSSPKLVSPTGNLDNENFPSNEDIILSNQEYSRPTSDVDFNPMNYGFGMYTDIEGGKYKRELDSQGNKKYQSVFKPKPGVISLTSNYQSTSNVYFVRNVSITWKCHHIDDLERLSHRFLTLNRLVYVEWGWNYADKPKTTFITPENLKNIKNPKKLRDKVINEGVGNFDAVLGYVSNFEWSSTGGGFECRTDIVSQGSDILSQRIGDDDVKVKDIGDDVSIEIGGTDYDDISVVKTGTDIAIEKKALNKLKDGRTLSGKYEDVRNNSNVLTRRFEVESTPISGDRGTTVIQTRGDGSVDIQTERGLEFTESFSFVLNNLHLKIKELLEDKTDITISETTLFANETELNQEIEDAVDESSEEYKRINVQVTKEYDEGNFSNWKKENLYNFRGAERFRYRAINMETRTRFGDRRKSAGKKEAKRKIKEGFGEVRDRKQTRTRLIKYDKNLIQTSIKTSYQKKPSDYLPTSGIYIGPDDTNKIIPKETWIRWGWFEDNILNRFFGLIDAEKTPILEFRSIRESETTNKFGTGKKINQERIHNHPEFLTEDIYKFIFPGKLKVGDVDEQNQRYQSRSQSLKEKGFKKQMVFKGFDSEQNSEEQTAAKLFIKRDPVTDKVIDGQLLIDQQQTHVN